VAVSQGVKLKGTIHENFCSEFLTPSKPIVYGWATYGLVQAWIVNLRTGTGLDCQLTNWYRLGLCKKLGDEYLMLAWAPPLEPSLVK
jgi:hypothetical protein